MLLGKFQTDCLEARFGQYRQLAGAKYDISLRQLYECEKKLRVLSVLQLKINTRDVTLKSFALDWEKFKDECETDSSICDMPVLLSNEDYASVQDNLPVITYIAGYSSFAINKKLNNCEHCKQYIVCSEGELSNIENYGLIKGITRGKLLYPSQAIVHVVLANYLVVNKVTDTEEFRRSSSHRKFVVACTIEALEAEEFIMLCNATCENRHEVRHIVNLAAWISTNTFLNNYCFKRNDKLVSNKLAKKRKTQTLT